jgi:hypothetical protein
VEKGLKAPRDTFFLLQRNCVCFTKNSQTTHMEGKVNGRIISLKMSLARARTMSRITSVVGILFSKKYFSPSSNIYCWLLVPVEENFLQFFREFGENFLIIVGFCGFAGAVSTFYDNFEYAA